MDNIVQKLGYHSLYSWVRTNISDKFKDPTKKYVRFSYHLARESGLTLSYDETIIFDYDKKLVEMEQDFYKLCLGRIDEALLAMKLAKPHERVLLQVKFTDKEGEVEQANYFIIRFRDEKYIHKTHGERTKQIIAVSKIHDDYVNLYKHHMTLNTYSKSIGCHDILKGLLDVTESKIKEEALSKLIYRLKEDKDYDGLNELKEITNRANSFNKFVKSIVDLGLYHTSILGDIKNLPMIGQPNYGLTGIPEKISRNQVSIMENIYYIKIFLKSSTFESDGNGNGYGVYLDDLVEKMNNIQEELNTI